MICYHSSSCSYSYFQHCLSAQLQPVYRSRSTLNYYQHFPLSSSSDIELLPPFVLILAFFVLYVCTRAHACARSASVHAFTSLSLMKLFPDWWLCLRSVCCSTCSAPHRKNFNLRGGEPTTSVTCSALETSAGSLSRCGWSGESLLSLPDLHIQYSDPDMYCTHTVTDTHACTHSSSLFMRHHRPRQLHFTNNS